MSFVQNRQMLCEGSAQMLQFHGDTTTAGTVACAGSTTECAGAASSGSSSSSSSRSVIVEVVFLVVPSLIIVVIVGFFFELFVYFDFVADDSAGLVPRFFETGAGVCWVKVALHRWASSLTIWNSCSRSAATS